MRSTTPELITAGDKPWTKPQATTRARGPRPPALAPARASALPPGAVFGLPVPGLVLGTPFGPNQAPVPPLPSVPIFGIVAGLAMPGTGAGAQRSYELRIDIAAAAAAAAAVAGPFPRPTVAAAATAAPDDAGAADADADGDGDGAPEGDEAAAGASGGSAEGTDDEGGAGDEGRAGGTRVGRGGGRGGGRRGGRAWPEGSAAAQVWD